MNIPQKHQVELAGICDLLQQAIAAPSLEVSHQVVADALRRAARLLQSLADAPAKLGRMGGQTTAKRGPEYFRKIAAMRKTKAGGRPRKQAK
jgi:GGDEF domain-containing protein